MSKSILETIREEQKKVLVGKRIEIENMVDPDPLPCGATGTITGIDGYGHILVNWDCGRYLSVIPDEDRFRILD